MKKIILGIFVVGCFVVYSVHGRNETSKATVTPKTSTATTSQSQPSSGAAGSGSSGTGGTMSPSPSSATGSSSQYKDGTYTGDAADALYGYIQVQATVQGGKLTDVTFLQYPSDRSTSREINSQAMPMLKQEAIQAQNAQVDGVSGATDSSQAFIQSLGSALQKAQA